MLVVLLLQATGPVLVLPALANGMVITSPPPQVVFVPLANACSLARHPTLPVLYVGCDSDKQSRNLVTFRLNADGSIDAGSKLVGQDYFSTSATNEWFAYRVLRPCVVASLNVLYLGADPPYRAQYFANTNNNELAVLALDKDGAPLKLLKSFRSNYSAGYGLVDMLYDSEARRLFIAYWVNLGWTALDAQGLPGSVQLNPVPGTVYHGRCLYVSQWKRMFAELVGPTLTVFKLTADGLGLEFRQDLPIGATSWISGNLEISMRHRKAYLLGSAPDPNQRLCIVPLTEDGRFTSLPRSFRLGDAVAIRFDFSANRLYEFTKDGMRIFALDENGCPTGSPKVFAFAYGQFRDALVDEPTGKVYLACSQPPPLAGNTQ